MTVILYTIDCPKCLILEKKLAEKGIEFKTVKDKELKFGRYIPNQTPHYDSILGVNLASDNQYAERIS